MSDGIADGLCQENSGFLFRHRCDRFAQTVCGRCGKPVCNEHSHRLEDGMVCTCCARQSTSELKPSPEEERAWKRKNAGGDHEGRPNSEPIHRSSYDPTHRSESSADAVLDDPFFQGPSWYVGFGGYRRSLAPASPSPADGASSADGVSPVDGVSPADDSGSPADGEVPDNYRSADTPMASEYDPADFTEGDAASFAEEGDESFEFDMGES